MPRVNNVMQLPPGTYGIPTRTIESSKYNTAMDDLVADLNAPRPISAGGTGATDKATARDNFEVPSDAEMTAAIAAAVAPLLKRAGDRMTGALSSAVKAHTTPAAGATEEFKYADGNTHSITVNGAITLNPTGLAEGDVLQINILYQAGSIAVSGTTQWELGGGQKGAALSDVGLTLTAGRAYRFVFEIVSGIRTGVVQ